MKTHENPHQIPLKLFIFQLHDASSVLRSEAEALWGVLQRPCRGLSAAAGGVDFWSMMGISYH